MGVKKGKQARVDDGDTRDSALGSKDAEDGERRGAADPCSSWVSWPMGHGPRRVRRPAPALALLLCFMELLLSSVGVEASSRAAKLQAWRSQRGAQVTESAGATGMESDGHLAGAPAVQSEETWDAPCTVDMHSPAGTYFVYTHMFSLQASISTGCGIDRFSAGMAGGDKPLRAIEISLNGKTIHPKRRQVQDHFLFIEALPSLFELHVPAACNLTVSILGDREHGREVLGHDYREFKVSFSELGQDMWVAHDLFPGKTGQQAQLGFFLEIGAFSGFELSNTVLLEQLGWEGVSVEPFPQEGTFEFRAVQGFPGRHELVRAVVLGGERAATFLAKHGGGAMAFGGVVDFYLAQGNDLESMINGTGPAQSGSAELVAVRSRTAHSILQETLQPQAGSCIIHYMSLDSEGSELDILQTFPFEHYLVAAITVEAHHQKRAKLAAFLGNKGFVVDTSASIGRDLFMRNAGIFDLMSIIPACKLRDKGLRVSGRSDS